MALFSSMPTKKCSTSAEPCLIGKRVVLRLPELRDASAIVDYLQRNREFHKPFEPIRPKEAFTVARWKKAIPAIRKEFQNDISVKFIMCPKDDLLRVIGVVNFSQIFRGVFHACYLGYAIDKDEQGEGINDRGNSAGHQVYVRATEASPDHGELHAEECPERTSACEGGVSD